MAAVVFDAGAVADLQHHLQVVLGAGEQALGFEQLALAAERHDAEIELLADRLHAACTRSSGMT